MRQREERERDWWEGDRQTDRGRQTDGDRCRERGRERQVEREVERQTSRH